jgi:hypothetical protein
VGFCVGGREMDWMAQQTRRLVIVGVFLAGMLGGASLATALEIGEQAPDFSLPSTTGETISLSQFRGKKHVLLEFYVNDFGAT